MHRAVRSDGEQCCPSFLWQIFGKAEADSDLVEPSGTVGLGETRGHGEPRGRQSATCKVSAGVEGHARGETADEELRRRGRSIDSTGIDGLVHEETVLRDVDLEQIALLVDDSRG